MIQHLGVGGHRVDNKASGLNSIFSAICPIEMESSEVGAAGVGVGNVAQRLSMC